MGPGIPLSQHLFRGILANYAIRQHLFPYLCASEITTVLGIFLPADKLTSREVRDYLNVCRDIFTDEECAELELLASQGKHCVLFGNNLGRHRDRLRRICCAPYQEEATQVTYNVWVACAVPPIPVDERVITAIPNVHGFFDAMLTETMILPFEWQLPHGPPPSPGDCGHKAGCPANGRPETPPIQVRGKVAYRNLYLSPPQPGQAPPDTGNRIWLSQVQSNEIISPPCHNHQNTAVCWAWLHSLLARYPPPLLRATGSPEHTLQYINVAAALGKIESVALDFNWPPKEEKVASLELCLRAPGGVPQGMNWPKFTIRLPVR